MNLVIIEGPGKRDTLKKYLGEGFEVVATKGHIRDLPEKGFGIDINKNFEPKYTLMPDKADVIEQLKAKKNKASKVYIATDPDREGEAIAWHVGHILGIGEEEPCRIEFNEISKNAVNKALLSPRTINMDLVHAQQGRRVLDRIVGYKASPVLNKKIQKNLSAGRVQSVALKIVVDREREIKNFKPEEYWNINALLSKLSSPKFKAALSFKEGKKYQSHSEKETLEVVDYAKKQEFIVAEVKKSVAKSHAPAPFVTSTLQQDALNKLGMTLRRTTMAAQQLYEGVEIKGEGKTALVTYIRTDSTRVSPEAQAAAKEFIINKFGKDYVPDSFNFFKTKKNAQDAHEAIRPINLGITPEIAKNSLSPDNYRLYKLIYDRFLASQMSEATFDALSVLINAGMYGFKVTGRTPLFLGWTAAYKAYDESKEEESDEPDSLPSLDVGDKLKLHDIIKEQKFTKPPPRYTEASLVKTMEEKGIGRPATYAPTILVLAKRRYTEKDGKYLLPTELGITVVEFLEKYFDDIMDVSFTAQMESQLDEVEEGAVRWQDLVAGFYEGFEKEVEKALGGDGVKVPVEVSSVPCDKCGDMMVVRIGKYGKFLACPNFPNCKNVKSLTDMGPKVAVAKCPDCGKNVYARKSKRGTLFYGCEGYPDCKFASWDIPTEEKCPECGSFLTKKPLKDETKIKCSNKECKFVRSDPPEEKE